MSLQRNKKVVYFVTRVALPISEVLKNHFKVTSEKQSLLFALGAIYLNRERVLQDRMLNPSDQLQIYLEPKRFPIESVKWKETVVDETRDFIIINKPPSIPVHSTEDNLTENILHQLRSLRGQELWVTHRLDTAVSGLMVLAKTPEYQSEFNRLLKQRKISKFYRALVEREPKTGLIKHFMSPEDKVPKKLSEEPIQNWLQCSLEILKVKPWIDIEGKKFWELEIELHTGRTHQIRAQLSWSGWPILGDKMYRGRNRAGFTRSCLALQSSRLEWADSTGKHRYEIESCFTL